MRIPYAIFLLLISLSGCREVIKEENQVSSSPDMSVVQTIQVQEFEAGFDVERFLDMHIDTNHSREYRQAVGEVLLKLLDFCDGTGKPERTTISTVETADGETTVSLSRRGTGAADFSVESDEYSLPKAMILRNKSVIALNWRVQRTDYEGATWDYIPALTDSLLESLAKITSLERVELGGGLITDAGLAKLASLTHLKSLQFGDETWRFPDDPSKLSYSAFDSLHGLVNLEELVLPRRAHQTGADSTPLFRALPHYPKLQHLSAIGQTLNRENMEHLTSCRQLESLDMDGTMTEPCLEFLEQLPKLKTLNLSVSSDDQSFELARLPVLEELVFSRNTIKTEEEQTVIIPIITFTNLPELKTVLLNSSSDVHFVISDNPKQTSCRVSFGGWISRQEPAPEKAILSIENLPILTGIEVWGKDFLTTEVNIANTPLLSYLWLRGLQQIKLSLTDWASNAITIGSFTADSKFPDGKNAITQLRCSSSDSPEVLLKLLLASPKVRELELENVPLSPEMLDAMFQMSDLEKLTLTRCTLPKAIDLSQLKTVQQLWLESIDLPAVLGHLPEVRELRLNRCTSPKEFSLVNFPKMTRIMVNYDITGCQSLLIKDAPQLNYAHIASWQIETMAFEGCPSLQNGMFVGGNPQNVHEPYRLKRLDLRGTRIQRSDFCINKIIFLGRTEILLD